MNRIKEELEDLARKIEKRCIEIVGDSSLVEEDLRVAIDVGVLSDEDVIRLDGMIDDAEEEYIDERHVAEDCFGFYSDENGVERKVFLSREVEYRDLVFAYEYVDGFILFDISFKLVNYMYSQDGCHAVSDEEWNKIMSTFHEVSEDKFYCDGDPDDAEDDFDEIFDYYQYCDELYDEEYDYDCFDKPKIER